MGAFGHVPPWEFIETIPEVEEGTPFGPPITTEPLRLAQARPANEIAEAWQRPCDLSWQRAQSHCSPYDWSRPTAASVRAHWDGAIL